MQINIQLIEKFNDPDNGATLRVHSIFGPTIQGEGPLAMHPAVFIRLAGCNLQCPQCDTDYTSGELARFPIMTQEVMARVRRLHVGPILVVISGGEPFRQNITPLCHALLDEDYQVQIETNGTLPPPFGFPAGNYLNKGAWVVVSPKAGKVHLRTEAIAVAWKYVLNANSYDPEDGLPIRALDHTASPRVARPPEDFPIGAIYLQPADVKDEELNAVNLRQAIRSCFKHGYTLGMQMHKVLGLE